MTRTVLRPARPGLSLAGALRRAHADRWPLLLVALVVALTSALAVTTPRVVGRTADDAVQVAVRDAGVRADTTMTLPFPDLGYGPPRVPQESAAETLDAAARLDAALPPELGRVLDPPVTAVASRSLPLLGRPVDRALGEVGIRLAWVADGAEPAVTWVAGAAPGRPAVAADALAGFLPDGPPVLPVEVALTEEAAAALGTGVGGHLDGGLPTNYTVDLVVTGLYRPVDPGDPAWAQVPVLLAPRTSGAGPTTATTVGALLSAGSLAAARLVLPTGDLVRTVVFGTDAEAVDAAAVTVVPLLVGALQTDPASLGVYPAPEVTSRLGLVLTRVRDGIATAQAQAGVLLAGVVAGAALVLTLAARLLATRRRAVLATQRARGASLAAIGLNLALESVVLTALAAGAGVLVGALAVPGARPAGWLVPVALFGALAAPVSGVLIARRATGGRRVPADRRQGRRARRDRQLRRVAAETVVVLLALGAAGTLQLRGVQASAADPIADLLLLAAPALGIAAGSVLLLRVVPLLLRGALRAAGRSRRAVPLLSAVQARSTAGEALPLLALTLTAGLVAVVATLGVTVATGQEETSWAVVGSDVTVSSGPGQDLRDVDLTAVAAGLAAAPGVEDVVPALVVRDTQLRVGTRNRTVTVLAADPAALARLSGRTPLPDAPDLGLLTDGGGSAPLVLVPPDVPLAGTQASVLVDGRQLPVDPVGRAPALGAVGEVTVVVDAAVLGTALGGALAPDTLWVVGPGAAAAVADTPALAGAAVRDRQDWLAGRRADPLTGGLTLVAAGAAGALLLLAAATALLAATAGAPARGRVLATLRTLGLTGGQARRISLGELLPPVLLSVLAGAALGTAVAALVREPLGLQLLTGGADAPELVVPAVVLCGVVLVLAALLALVVLGVVAVESSARRRERLGEVLRVG